MEIENQIKNHRKKLRWSQEELAKNAYISSQTISEWENGESYPDIHSILLLGKLFDTSPDELVKGDVEAMKNKITENDTKKSKASAWIINAVYIIVLLALLPLIESIGWVGSIIWGVIFAAYIFISIKTEKKKNSGDLQTYKEITAFLNGKPLEEISAERLKNVNKPLKRVIFGTLAASIIIAAYAFFLFK